MKYIALVLIAGLLSFTYIDSIYNLSVKTLDGQLVPLSQFQGKKMLFVLLPLSAQDSALKVEDVEALSKRYDSSLIIIGIVSKEAGFDERKSGDKERLKALYASHGRNFYITEGLRVKKGSGEQQSPVLKWLTSKDANRHFNNDAEGPGQKFFVDEGGELYAVIGAKISLTHSIIDRILSKPMGRVKVAKDKAPLKP